MSSRYALIIANTEYNDPSLAQLTAPGRDAEDFARVLMDKDIGAFDDVKVLLNNSEPQVREAIDEFFDQKKHDDLLVLYFSGHGVRDESGSLYLALKNTTRPRLHATALKSDFIREEMDQTHSKRVVLILDCCNSGAFAQGTKAITGGSVGTASAFEGTGYGRVVLTASDSTQFAWEGDKVIGDTQNSLFTHFLIQGLEGEADQDGDGQITIDELYDYAYGEIVQRTPKQTPGKWSFKQQGELLLVQNLRPKRIKPMELPKELADAIEDSRAFVREGAVEQLRKIMAGKNPGLALSAQEALEKISLEDDSRHVARLAAHALETIHQTEQISAQKEEEHLVHEKVVQEKTALDEAPRTVVENAAIKKPLVEENKKTVDKEAPVPITKTQQKVAFSQKKIGFAGLAVVTGLIIMAVLASGFYKSSPNAKNTNATSTSFWISQYEIKTEHAMATSSRSASYQATSQSYMATDIARSTRSAATAQAKLTQTAKAVATEKEYWNSASIVDTFNNNSAGWQIGNVENNYYVGSKEINQGQILWNVTKVNNNKGFVDYVFYPGSTSNDFDVKIDAKKITGVSGDVCYGIVFRVAKANQHYIFEVCDNSYYDASNLTSVDWVTLIDWKKSETINPSGWNTLRVSARGEKFDFYINGIHVDTATDSSLKSGSVGFAISVYNDKPFQIAFDNFYLINH